jgi:hypothetical protein
MRRKATVRSYYLTCNQIHSDTCQSDYDDAETSALVLLLRRRVGQPAAYKPTFNSVHVEDERPPR